MGQNSIVQVADSERSENLSEETFVGKIERKTLKLEEGRTYSVVHFQNNDWTMYVHWYTRVPFRKNRSADWFYKKGDVQ